MAAGTVSALEPNQWQFISSAATTSQTEVTFNSLSGYKQYRVVYIQTGNALGDIIYLRFNGDTGNNYFANATRGSANSGNNATYMQINASGTSAVTAYQGYVDIFDADKPIEKTTEGHGSYYMGNVFGGWMDTATITSISFISAQVMTAGTVKLYGIAS